MAFCSGRLPITIYDLLTRPVYFFVSFTLLTYIFNEFLLQFHHNYIKIIASFITLKCNKTAHLIYLVCWYELFLNI